MREILFRGKRIDNGECERCRMRQKNVWDYEGWQNFCGYCGAKMDGKRKDGDGECLNT